MPYTIIYKTGTSFISNVKTLVEAKKEATEYAGYRFGSICIIEGADSESSSDPVAIKFEHDNEWIEP
ncbi:hypothetical protein [Desulfobacter latus]|uniref:Uncharacterized protein n=1 Tax=Desulfobacter latus TaxID=2292 RepID=A0A850T5F3_9BACT|nr:hypothetical protein [Desulfobacter latus]NWH03497.1 hypothetical protein [Desulfobacter latus]